MGVSTISSETKYPPCRKMGRGTFTRGKCNNRGNVKRRKRRPEVLPKEVPTCLCAHSEFCKKFSHSISTPNDDWVLLMGDTHDDCEYMSSVDEWLNRTNPNA